MIRALVLAVVLLACHGASPTPDASLPAPDAAAAPPAETKPFASYLSRAGGFRVTFPEGKSPDVETADVTKGLSVRLFEVRYGSSAYLVTYDDSGKTSGRTTAQIVSAAKEAIVETTAGTIAEERAVQTGAATGTELVVSATTAGIAMRQRIRIYVVNGRLYQVLVVSPSWSGQTALEEPFFASFELLP